MENAIRKTNKISTKSIVLVGMMAALAYIFTVVGRVPVVSFLKYDPKDIIIALAAFMINPWAGLAIAVVDSLVEMFTISDTGPIGMLMNIIASVAYVLPASIIYRKRRTLSAAAVGLLIGTLSMTAAMLLWNYLITPIYMKTPREVVEAMLIPVFLPFNLLKATVNSTLFFMLYKPVATALRKSSLISPESADRTSGDVKKTAIVYNVVSAVILIACVAAWIIWRVVQSAE